MKVFALLALFSVVLYPSALIAQRAIPDNNLGYPVRISLSGCSNGITSIEASGFFLNTGSADYLVTARHVLFRESQGVPQNQTRPPQCNQADLLSYSANPKERIPNRFQLNLRELWKEGYVRAHPTHDVAAVKIGVFRPVSGLKTKGIKGRNPGVVSSLPGVKFLSRAPSGMLSVGLDAVGRLGSVLVANNIYIMGYPASIGIRKTPQVDYSVPLLRKGIVSALNYGKKTIILDCFVAQGNSGGPVLEVSRMGLQTHFAIIGVVSQFVPAVETWVNTTLSYYNMQFHNSGYTVAEPMDFVLQLIGK